MLKKHFGFTLVEVLIAAAILILAGLGAILVEKQSIQSGTFNKHKLVAENLAQEGINVTKLSYSNELLRLSSGGAIDWSKIINGATAPDTSKIYQLRKDASLKYDGTLTEGSETIILNGVTYTREIKFQ